MVAMSTRVSSLKFEGAQYKLIAYPIRRPAALAALTAAELDVAEAVIEGASTREIATRRRVSERTIANQLGQIYRKLGLCSRHELVTLAVGATGRGAEASCGSGPA
jgi:DNA-binding CsgD family transcriptional regulator